jgi:thioesterase domain-containing protein
VGSADSAAEVVPVEILKAGTGTPLCCIHDVFGLSWSYRALGKYLDCPIIGINDIPQDGEPAPTSIRSMAVNYADRLQALYPDGPYNILGWSFGGVVAHELAVELRRRGCEVHRLVLLDPAVNANRALAMNRALGESHVLKHILRTNHVEIPKRWGPITYEKAEELIRQQKAVEFGLPPRKLLDFLIQSLNVNWLFLLEHELDVFDGDAAIFSAAQRKNVLRLRSRRRGRLARLATRYLQRSWRPYVSGEIAEHSVNCTHYEMLSNDALNEYGKRLKALLESRS